MSQTDTVLPLSAATLTSLPARVPGPECDRSEITTGIVHFGVGGFHRAHQAMNLDRLMNSGKAFDWGICGVGVMPFDARMKQIMDEQDCLYTLVLKDPDGTWEPRVIGSIIEDLYAPDDPQAVIEKMADPVTRIVSLTVTEGGYNFHQVTGEFDAENPAVAADLVPGAEPRTTFGLITEALARRRARGLPAFTIMFCDNIQGIGHMAHRVFTAFAGLREATWRDTVTGEKGLAAWVETDVRFPNSMVDRITDEDMSSAVSRLRRLGEGAPPGDQTWAANGARAALTSAAVKRAGSNSAGEPRPSHSSIASWPGWPVSPRVSIRSAYPQTPPQSSGGAARRPPVHDGYLVPSTAGRIDSTWMTCCQSSPKS